TQSPAHRIGHEKHQQRSHAVITEALPHLGEKERRQTPRKAGGQSGSRHRAPGVRAWLGHFFSSPPPAPPPGLGDGPGRGSRLTVFRGSYGGASKVRSKARSPFAGTS